MLENIPKISDGAPIFGMNSVDDPKDLKPGECVELVNAKPGTPPEPRPGNLSYLLTGASETYPFAPVMAISDSFGNPIILSWALDQTNEVYQLLKTNLIDKAVEVIGTIAGAISPMFSFEKIHNKIYCFSSEDATTFNEQAYLLRHRIVDLFNTDVSGGNIEFYGLNISADVDVVDVDMISGSLYGGSDINKWIAYGFTYIRRTDANSINASGEYIRVDTALPGESESMEDPETRIAVQLLSPYLQPVLIISDESDSIAEAIAQGATHLRIWKTNTFSSEENALAGTLYYCMDIPLLKNYRSLSIEELTAPSNNVVVETTASHGYVTGDKVTLTNIVGATQLNKKEFTITKLTSKTFSLDGTETNKYSAYISGGNAGKRFTIGNIAGPAGVAYKNIRDYPVWTDNGSQNTVWLSGTSVSNSAGYYAKYIHEETEWNPPGGNVIITITGHGLVSGDTVEFFDVEGCGKAIAAATTTTQKLGFVTSNYGTFLETNKKTLSAAKGLNNNSFVIDKIDANSFSLRGENAKDYNAWKSGTGYIQTKKKTIASVVAPTNQVKIKITNHGLKDGEYAYITDVAQPTNFNNRQFVVEVIDANYFELVGESTVGVLPYTSGGKAQLSAGGVVHYDTVSNTVVGTDGYLCTSTDYAIAPNAKFARFIKDRLWLFGVVNEPMKAFFSEIVGGDGGCPQEDAISFPKKYVSFFKYNYSVTCQASAGDVETGIDALGNDIYFFTESKLFALYGGDPTLATPVLVSDNIGLMFPYTLTKASIEFFGGLCFLFLSNKGPAVLKTNGEVVLFSKFKITELWPIKNSELYTMVFNVSTKAFAIANCTSIFWDNTWYVMYKNIDNESRIFGFYFNPELRYDQQAPHGAFKIEQLEI